MIMAIQVQKSSVLELPDHSVLRLKRKYDGDITTAFFLSLVSYSPNWGGCYFCQMCNWHLGNLPSCFLREFLFLFIIFEASVFIIFSFVDFFFCNFLVKGAWEINFLRPLMSELVFIQPSCFTDSLKGYRNLVYRSLTFRILKVFLQYPFAVLSLLWSCFKFCSCKSLLIN